MTWRLRDHALSSCSEGITIADPSQPDAPLVYVNDAFLQITGYSHADVIGRNCRFLQGQETSREAVATLKAAVAARRKATVELLNYKKTGGYNPGFRRGSAGQGIKGSAPAAVVERK